MPLLPNDASKYVRTTAPVPPVDVGSSAPEIGRADVHPKDVDGRRQFVEWWRGAEGGDETVAGGVEVGLLSRGESLGQHHDVERPVAGRTAENLRRSDDRAV